MKTTSFLIITLLATAFSFAQLTVRQNAYVFVTDEVLYVTDDVNLQESTANLYLRDDAQLVQGNNVGNTGLGKLSVYQTGTANTYIYNYWSSPVGNTDTNTTGNRSFRANANFYDVVTAPITSNPATFTTAYDGSSAPLVISSFWLYTYDPGTLYSDWDAIFETGTVDAGYGFTMKGNPSGAQLYDFRGKPHNGTITANILNGQETLVGNPYPSALDAYYFIHDPLNTGIADEYDPIDNPYFTGVLKYWEQHAGSSSHVLSNYVGGYAHYTNATTNDNGTPADLSDDTIVESFVPATFYMYLLDGTPASGAPVGTGVKTARRYIPIGQGFMIEGNTNGTVTFRNSQRAFYRESGTDSYFFRTDANASNSDSIHPAEAVNTVQYTEDGYSVVPNDLKRFRINIGFDNNGIESYTRQLLMNFHHSTTEGFDYGFEAKGGGDLESDAHWTVNDAPYLIQALPYDEDLKIPLIVKIENEQLSRFSILDVQNFEHNQPIYLHDKQTGLYINLQEQAYELTLEAGHYTNRFEITFRQNTLTTNIVEDDALTVFQNTKNHELTILNPNGLNIKSMALFDVSGKRVINETSIGNQSEYNYSTKSLSDGIYVASISIDDTVTVTKKVLIKN
ncbi:T9SS type A sorting domain-containing protein [Psychroserpens sp. SPM9]|uniref:T9SS type A sorting domain-containing protein n=1 Tax=Psychroserpens sp. SPM9 TaxID=2975598 RepID=UPI0021A36A29|nr:T9SS type A sorting domain-containing protein [Psychroserpens sp. SPM9]MDG5491404.1 T9SS type A sorting domain-containing protein [Psychroserpens sp. SPM9]